MKGGKGGAGPALGERSVCTGSDWVQVVVLTVTRVRCAVRQAPECPEAASHLQRASGWRAVVLAVHSHSLAQCSVCDLIQNISECFCQSLGGFTEEVTLK